MIFFNYYNNKNAERMITVQRFFNLLIAYCDIASPFRGGGLLHINAPYSHSRGIGSDYAYRIFPGIDHGAAGSAEIIPFSYAGSGKLHRLGFHYRSIRGYELPGGFARFR
jgi:hypothetical protein